MDIVANSFFLRNLRNLPFFTLKLGQSKKVVNDENNRFRKLNEFHLKYKNLYGGSLMEFGNIAGKVNFYEDVTIKGKLFLIFKDEDIYEIQWDDDELVDMESYILETLRKIDESENDESENEEVNYNKIEEYASENNHDLWVAQDDKNKGRKYVIDQTLDKNAYREALLNNLGKK